LGKPDDDIVYSAYHNFLENNSWEQFKDTCTRFLADFRAEEDHQEIPEGSGEPPQSEPAIASGGCGIRLPRGSERQRVPYEGWSGGTCGVGDILCFNCAQNNAPEGSREPAQSEPAEQAYFQRVALRAEEDYEETPEGSREPAQSEPAEHAEPAENVIIPLEERTNSMSRRHLEYLDHEAYVNGEYYVTDVETDSAEEEDESWGDTTNPYEDGVATQTETLQECLIRLADETNDQGFIHLSADLNNVDDRIAAAHLFYLADRDWGEFKDTCTRFLVHFRAEEDHEETLEGSGESAQSEPAQSEPAIASGGCAKMVQKRKEETPEQLLVEDIQQCCIRLAHETNDQGFKHLLYQYNDLVVKAAYEVYLEDRNWEKFKDTCTRILAHFRAENDHEETPEGSERVEPEARSSFWDDENNWTDDFVSSMRSIAERYDWDDYETDPEDKAADLNDY